MLFFLSGDDVSVFWAHAMRQTDQVPCLSVRRADATDATAVARQAPQVRKRDVARGGEGMAIVGQRAGVELDRLFVAQPDAEPQPRLVVLRDPHEAVGVAHP